jgi:dTDP-4-amino-4,6-dideoxygalactose transaminase
MQIPQWPQSGERELQLLRDVLDSPQWGGFHPFVSEFEASFAAYQHCSFGIAAINGTVTLEVALAALDIGPGDEVIVPAISFVSTATAVSRVGATPVFVDIEPWSFNIDPERVSEAIGPKTKAVIAVHFGGPLCRIDELVTLCREQNLQLLEDAAHAHGSEWNGRRAGSFGKAGSFSFQNGKVLSSGEGGMLVSSDAAFAELARSLINQGRIAGKGFFEHYRLASNLRMTAFQAAVLLAQFENLSPQIEQRTAAANRIRREVPADLGIVWQKQPPEITRNSQYLLLGRLHHASVSRDQFCERLNATGVPCAPFYPHTLYRNPLYIAGGCRVMPCPNAEASILDAFWLPHRVLLADEESISEVIAVIHRAVIGKSEPVTAKERNPALAGQTASRPGVAS